MRFSFIFIYCTFQLAHFFTSAAGENGSNPIHSDVLSGDLRREMELQGTSLIQSISITCSWFLILLLQYLSIEIN